jgi:acetylornithine deacetylase/succinyl-diaminopimelate desuccinylase-like protein
VQIPWCAGSLEGVDAIFGFHNMPYMPLGAVGSNPGTIMAGSAEFKVTFHGRGGHAAMPQNVIDPTPAAAQFITALQVQSLFFCSCEQALNEAWQWAGPFAVFDLSIGIGK